MLQYYDNSVLNRARNNAGFRPGLNHSHPGCSKASLLAGLFILVILFPGNRLLAHGDIDLRIEAVTAEISIRPGDADLYLKRAELQRFHADWQAAAADYEKARKLAPGHPQLDFLEARFFLDTGKGAQALQFVERFIKANPSHTTALVVRAGAYEILHQCSKAATDLAAAINLSAVGGPELYLRLAKNLMLSGCDDAMAAGGVLDTAIAEVGPVPGLVQLATSVSLSLGRAQKTLDLLAQLPNGMITLPQWRYRQALALCLDSRTKAARQELQNLLADLGDAPETRRQRWQGFEQSAIKLVNEPELQASCCRAAAVQLLEQDNAVPLAANN